MPGGRAGTPGASYDRTTREQESQEDREARLDRQRLRTKHLTPRQRWVPHLVMYLYIDILPMLVLCRTCSISNGYICYKYLKGLCSLSSLG